MGMVVVVVLVEVVVVVEVVVLVDVVVLVVVVVVVVVDVVVVVVVVVEVVVLVVVVVGQTQLWITCPWLSTNANPAALSGVPSSTPSLTMSLFALFPFEP